MSTTVSFKVSELEKEYFNNILDQVQEKYNLSTKSDVLKKIFEVYEGKDVTEYETVPLGIKKVLDEIPCDFLRYDETLGGYQCYELFHKKKEPKPLSSSNYQVLRGCRLCLRGKETEIQKKINAQLRKKSIKGLLDLREILIKLRREGGIAQIFICKGKLLKEHELILSLDGQSLNCPLEDNKEVKVIEHCYNQVNPQTVEPPCQYLIDPHIRVQVEPPERAEEIVEELKQITEQSTQTHQQVTEMMNQKTSKPKEVEAEVIENDK